MVRTINKNKITKIVKYTYNFENVSAIFIAFFSPQIVQAIGESYGYAALTWRQSHQSSSSKSLHVSRIVKNILKMKWFFSKNSQKISNDPQDKRSGRPTSSQVISLFKNQ